MLMFPSMFESATNLAHLSVSGFSLGTPKAPVKLHGMWANLKCLKLRCACKHSDRLAWRNII